MELEHKVAIVTGAGRGAGRGIAETLAREGARVVVLDRDAKAAEQVAAAIKAERGEAMPVTADVTDWSTLEAAVASVSQRFGRIDVLVNNAGVESKPRLLGDLDAGQWDYVLGVNLKGVFLCCKAVLPAMEAGGGGRIVNIASIAGMRMTFFGSLEYTVSKHGVVGLTHHLAWELADRNITVNAVCPGAVQTPLMEQSTTPELREHVVRRAIPLGRMCRPQDIGEAVSFFASDRAGLITGQLLAVDGGVLTGFGEDLRPLLHARMKA